jgi:hypothetical protein
MLDFSFKMVILLSTFMPLRLMLPGAAAAHVSPSYAPVVGLRKWIKSHKETH